MSDAYMLYNLMWEYLYVHLDVLMFNECQYLVKCFYVIIMNVRIIVCYI